MKLSQKYNKNNSQKPTNQPTDQKPTSEIQEKTNKIHECGVGKGLVQQRW